MDAATWRKALVNRLMYRSKQRGFLEMDLLMGLWAETRLPDMSDDMLLAFHDVLEMENPDLYKWLTGRELAPPEMRRNVAFQALLEHVRQQLKDNAAAATRADPGKEWVRGWDDWKSATQRQTAPSQ
ncbi:hypothetical protein WJX72_007626 [[Myrmecia] bisecta]|uniref:FAD assembly factor SdhE n=1 Tax=[Myrmecia] bisecta TaxID=41462 RepID=A0AAW1PY08_9CHLO